jgi:hypothetical protein
LLALPGPHEQRFFPVIQFGGDGMPVPGLSAVREALPTNVPRPFRGSRGERCCRPISSPAKHRSACAWNGRRNFSGSPGREFEGAAPTENRRVSVLDDDWF